MNYKTIEVKVPDFKTELSEIENLDKRIDAAKADLASLEMTMLEKINRVAAHLKALYEEWAKIEGKSPNALNRTVFVFQWRIINNKILVDDPAKHMPKSEYRLTDAGFTEFDVNDAIGLFSAYPLFVKGLETKIEDAYQSKVGERQRELDSILYKIREIKNFEI